jgi:glycosyltransferase involved in cell wall biosynthesis
MSQPLVSIIVPTRNSAPFIRACLQSIRAQSYPHIELIVVDRDSTDTTKQIAAEFTPHVLNHGPERSAQRNFGVEHSKGEYVLIIDSDMELTPEVVAVAVETAEANPSFGGITIPEESFGQGFWAQCKRLEKSFYVGVHWIEAARFFPREVYQELSGYDTTLISGEDWDLSQRAAKLGPILHIDEFIRHNEGHIKLRDTLKKKYYYAQHAREYLARNPVKSKLTSQNGPLERYKLFFSHPIQLFRNPIVGVGMLIMKTFEFTIGAFGYFSLIPNKNSKKSKVA